MATTSLMSPASLFSPSLSSHPLQPISKKSPSVNLLFRPIRCSTSSCIFTTNSSLSLPHKRTKLLPRAATAEAEAEPTEIVGETLEPPPVEVQIAASAAAETPKGEDVFAIVMIGSRQYIVFPGRFLYVQRLKGAEVNDKIVLSKVLLVGTRTKAYIGQPVVTNAAVHAVVEEQGLDKKVVVFKYKKKKNYRRNIGHRQPNTRIKITGITGYQDFPAETMPETVAA